MQQQPCRCILDTIGMLFEDRQSRNYIIYIAMSIYNKPICTFSPTDSPIFQLKNWGDIPLYEPASSSPCSLTIIFSKKMLNSNCDARFEVNSGRKRSLGMVQRRWEVQSFPSHRTLGRVQHKLLRRCVDGRVLAAGAASPSSAHGRDPCCPKGRRTCRRGRSA